MREITTYGAKICLLSHMYFGVYGMGDKARFLFPGGKEAGFRVDFYLLPIFDKERIGERAQQITL